MKGNAREQNGLKEHLMEQKSIKWRVSRNYHGRDLGGTWARLGKKVSGRGFNPNFAVDPLIISFQLWFIGIRIISFSFFLSPYQNPIRILYPE